MPKKGIKKKANPEYDRVKHPIYDYFNSCLFYLRRYREKRKPKYFYYFCSECVSLYDQISELIDDDPEVSLSSDVRDLLDDARIDLDPFVGASRVKRKKWNEVFKELKKALKTLRLTDITVGKPGDVKEDELFEKT